MKKIEQERIAEEIVQQLGGRRFILMTGAHDFLALDSGVQFKLPSTDGFTKQGIDLVEIKCRAGMLFQYLSADFLYRKYLFVKTINPRQ